MDSCKDILELNFNGWRLLHGSWKFQAIHCFSLPTDLPKGRRAKLCKIIHFVCKTDSPSGSGILKYCHCCPRPVICIAILMIIQGAAICIAKCILMPYVIYVIQAIRVWAIYHHQTPTCPRFHEHDA